MKPRITKTQTTPSRNNDDTALRVPDKLPVTRPGTPEEHQSLVLYGRSGTGKTTLAGTFPQPILLLDVNDQGTDSVKDVKELDVLTIEDFDDLKVAYYWLKANPGKYKTVIIDTVSQLQNKAIQAIKSNVPESKLGHWGTMTKADWGETASLLREWLENFRNLECYVIFIAQDRNFGGEEDDSSMIEPTVGPRLMPSVASALNANVHVVGHTFIRETIKEVVDPKTKKKKDVVKVEYCLRIGPNSVYVTKVRKPKLVRVPAVIVDPTFDELMEAIKGE